MKSITNNPGMSVLILLLLTANIVTLVLLWTNKKNNNYGNKMPVQPNGQVFEFVTRELRLDSVQQQQYKLLREEHQAGQRPLQDNIRKAKDDFFILLQQGTVADSLLQMRSSKVAAEEQLLELYTFKHFQKLRALCNKVQQSKFDSIIQEVLKNLGPARRPPGPPPGMGNGDNKPPPPGPRPIMENGDKIPADL